MCKEQLCCGSSHLPLHQALGLQVFATVFVLGFFFVDDTAGIWTQGTMLIPFPLDDMPITGIFCTKL